MRNLTLNYYERVQLWNLIGAHKAPRLREAAVLLRCIEKVRPSDEEARETQLTLDRTQMSWRTPAPGYGEREIAFEDEEAAALVGVLDTLEGVRVADWAWIVPIAAALGGAVAPVNGLEHAV
jgi:hypothetical protein